MINAVTVRRFCIYAAVGGLGTASHYALLIGLVNAGWMTPAPAAICGALLGAIINFLLNSRLTFGVAVSSVTARRFSITAAAAVCVNGLGMVVLVDKIGIDFRIAQLLITLSVLLLTFFVNSLWTFRPRDE